MADTFDRLKTALADRYAIQEELGAGGMATVYLAEDLKHHRKVAVKVLRPELAAILGAERFLKEIETTANLQHPHILPLFDSGEADSFLYYVMPYVEGESLRDKLNRDKQLGVEEAVEIAKGVAAATDYAHRQGVIHRDIKPENILIHDGQPVVADFGIALAVTTAGGTRLTETGLSLGTPQYMSPEQATGEREVTAKSDVYSLGAVVYEMLVGDPPHSGNTVQAIIAKVVSVEPTPIADLRHTVPRNVDAAVQKALAKVPADRFSRPSQFSEALSNPGFTLPSLPDSVDLRQTVLTWKRRALGMSGLAAVAIAVGLWGWITNPPVPPLGVRRLTLDVPGQFSVAPDGSHIVYTGAGGKMFVRDIAVLQPRSLETDGNNPFHSPDGASIGFFVNGGGISSVPSAGGPPTLLLPPGFASLDLRFYGAAWGGGYIYFTKDETSGLFRLPEGGNEPPEPVTSVKSASGEHNHQLPEVLPGGQGILYTSEWGDSSLVMVHSFRTGESRRLAAGRSPKYLPPGYVVFRTIDGKLQALPFDTAGMKETGSAVSVESGVGAFGLARDGTLFYRPTRQVEQAVVLVDRYGNETPLLSNFGNLAGPPKLSPDGARVVFGRRRPDGIELWVHTIGAGTPQPITSVGQNYYPTWSPDGESIAFGSNRVGGTYSVYVKRSDGRGEAEVVLHRPNMSYFAEQWTPDDQLILFSSGDSTGRLAWMVSAAPGSEPQPLIPDCIPCTFAQVSPNGRYVAYNDEPSNGEVWVAEIANPNATKLQVSVDGGLRPYWSANGREIFYTSQDHLMSAALEFGEQVRVVTTTQLFETASRFQTFQTPGVDPLGRGFVFITKNEVRDPPLVVAQGFVEELKAKVGN